MVKSSSSSSLLLLLLSSRQVATVCAESAAAPSRSGLESAASRKTFSKKGIPASTRVRKKKEPKKFVQEFDLDEFKSKDEWWMDPLAVFEEDAEDEEEDEENGVAVDDDSSSVEEETAAVVGEEGTRATASVPEHEDQQPLRVDTESALEEQQSPPPAVEQDTAHQQPAEQTTTTTLPPPPAETIVEHSDSEEQPEKHQGLVASAAPADATERPIPQRVPPVAFLPKPRSDQDRTESSQAPESSEEQRNSPHEERAAAAATVAQPSTETTPPSVAVDPSKQETGAALSDVSVGGPRAEEAAKATTPSAETTAPSDEDSSSVASDTPTKPSPEPDVSSSSSPPAFLTGRTSMFQETSSAAVARKSGAPVFPIVKTFVSENTAASALLVYTVGKSIVSWTSSLMNRRNKREPVVEETSQSEASAEDDDPACEEEDEEPCDDVEEDETENVDEDLPEQQRRGWFGSVGKHTSERSEALQSEVEELRRLREQAEADKVNVEQEYEKANWQLQETLSELDSLKSTTRHLQAQLADNEDVLAQAVRDEREKAREELLRMKEAMVKVVEREREEMREEFMKQAAELQMLWKEKEDASDSETV